MKINFHWVTKDNFDEQLEQFKDHHKICNFISIDTEFSGLGFNKINQSKRLDPIDLLYKKFRIIAKTFQIFQFGVTLYNESSDQINVYTFVLFNHDEEIPSLYSNKTLKFLRQNNLDFNEIIDKGIDYKQIMKIQLKLEKRTEENQKKIIVNSDSPSAKKQYISNIDQIIKLFLLNKNINYYDIKTENAFYRKLIYDNFDKCSDVIITPWSYGYNDSNKYVRIWKSKPATGECDILKQIECQKMGFSQVIDIILRTKDINVSTKDPKIIIHNGLIDLCFIVQKFVADLPKTFNEFKDIFKPLCKFYDTKHIAVNKLNKPRRLNLEMVFNEIMLDCENLLSLGKNGEILGKRILNIKMEIERYQQEMEKSGKVTKNSSHSAGFDSLMTLCVHLYYIDKVINSDENKRKAFIENGYSDINTINKFGGSYVTDHDNKKLNVVGLIIKKIKDKKRDIMKEFNKFGYFIKIIDVSDNMAYCKLLRLNSENKDPVDFWSEMAWDEPVHVVPNYVIKYELFINEVEKLLYKLQ